MAIVRIIFGYIVAVVVATATASAFQTLMVAAGLEASGVSLPLATRLEMGVADFRGLAPQFGPVVAIGFAIAFLIAALLRRIAKPLAAIAYPAAGAAAIAAALILMPIMLDLGGLTPLAGTRGPLGFVLQCIAGAFGGFVFAAFAVRHRA